MNQTTTKFLTTRQLARLWLVSEATIKRWADAGHLCVSRTIGGHRRFSLEEVARFQTERGLSPASVSTRERRSLPQATDDMDDREAFDAADAAEGFFEAIKGGREGVAASILLRAYLEGVELARVFDESVSVAMWRIGKLWHSGDLSVADEHLATRTAVRALESLSTSVRRRYVMEERQAICCATEDEFHEIPALCAQVLLESEGWGVKNFGPNTPFFALTDAVRKYRPALVCVSTTLHSALERRERDYEEFRQVTSAGAVRVVLGGEGFRNEAVRRRFPADLHAESFKEFAEFIRKQT